MAHNSNESRRGGGGGKWLLKLKCLLALACVSIMLSRIPARVQADNNIGCLLDASVCEPYEYCYGDLGAGGVCLSANELRIATAASDEARLETALRSLKDAEDDDDDDDDESSSDDADAATRSQSEYEVAANDEDEDEEEQERGPIMQSLRSEEATPLYLADAPIRVHKYNFEQQIDDDDNKIDDFVSDIENVKGGDNGSSDDDSDEDDSSESNGNGDGDDDDENDQDDYKTRVLRMFLNRIGFPTNRVNNEETENSLSPEYIDALTKAGHRTKNQRLLSDDDDDDDDDDDEDEDDDDENSDEAYGPITDPKRSMDVADKFYLLTNENGVPPVESDDDSEDESSDQAAAELDDEEASNGEEDKILERIHHDLRENALIERLVGALQRVSSSEGHKLQEIDKRFESRVIPDQENMMESGGGGGFKYNSGGYANIQDEYIDDSYVFIETDRILSDDEIKSLVEYISAQSSIPLSSFKNITRKKNLLMFKLENADRLIDDSNKTMEKIAENGQKLLVEKGIKIISYGIGRKTKWTIRSQTRSSHHQQQQQQQQHPFNIDANSETFILVTLVTCVALTTLLVVLTVVYMCKRRSHMSDSLLKNVSNTPGGGAVYRINFSDDESLIEDSKRASVDGNGNVFVRTWRRLVEGIKCAATKSRRCAESSSSSASAACAAAASGVLPAAGQSSEKQAADYEELCRQRAKVGGGSGNKGNVSPTIVNEKSDSPRSSTSSWSEEPIKSHNIDITTGHSILTYMEEHLNDKNRLQEEWTSLCEYEPEPNKTEVGSLPENMTKNRYSNILPFDHSRVKLKNRENDYINANYIVDDDPRNPSYIAAQGPLMHTTNDFWHMVWEEESVVIVSLCRTIEYGSAKCHQFWPGNGSCVYDKFEIHLVSEHVWCEDYLVRNFFLKNLEQNQTRTVTQFHFLTWPENGVPQNVKSFLDFRRRVNKSFKAKSSPLVIHCNDGVGRTGTYLLMDMVLNKISKGAKEIDIAATLEFLRDQRPGMIKNKAQFEYSFAVITEELHNMLKALRQ